jgi:hypothetical protein
MYFYSAFLLFATLNIGFNASGQALMSNSEKVHFSAPVDFPIFLAGNFGELRATHFHAGIDIKTEQVEGKRILAADSGYIFRINVQTGGYGHALYLMHPSGRVTVYGHLRQFAPEVEKWVKDQQYAQKSFETELFPEAGRFTFRKGQLIGFSGNTGSSGGPHLHFEIRDKTGSVPFNALKYGFNIKDAIPPKIFRIAFYALDDQSLINGKNQKLILGVSGKNGIFSIPSNAISLQGNIGIGIETYDFLNNSSNACGVYEISLRLDNMQRFLCRFDSIPFSMSGYINSHVDYEEKMKSGKSIQKLFLDPNNKLNIYKVALQRGILRFTDDSIHRVEIAVNDAMGNNSTLKFSIQSSGIKPPDTIMKDSIPPNRFYYDSLNVFENQDIKVVIPGESLFSNLRFQYSVEPSDSLNYSDLYTIHNEYTPLFKPYILSIRCRPLPFSLQEKALIVQKSSKGLSSQGGEFINGFVTARVKTFGMFYIALDTIPPIIRPQSFVNGQKYQDGQVFSFHIQDMLSGIRTYSGFIDGEWALFEYDAKSDRLTYTIDGKRLKKGIKHILELTVTDKKDNITRYGGNFFY